jgi:hypothetical protein
LKKKVIFSINEGVVKGVSVIAIRGSKFYCFGVQNVAPFLKINIFVCFFTTKSMDILLIQIFDNISKCPPKYKNYFMHVT